ncbi:hypothetical protein RD792_008493 [Penstemon davidsonii]|uniref:Cytochrome P450 n=1 Tax=Penstemon davidsonii TaxID=160366 RepID=A0ABR0DAI3_9LAMI|nr:hypothetical protein RD792_008493 [Penstemon davidsonii]
MEIQFPFNFITFLLSLSIFFFFFLIIKGWKKVRAPQRLPPSPPKLPIIGHLHHIITSVPHHYSLRELANKYGPLMHLKFGQVSTIIVSSRDIAKEVFKTHDLACADRPKTVATQIMWYNHTDILFCPYGDYWRQMRKICILELLSNKNVRSFEYIRKDEALVLTESILSSSGAPFNLTEKIFLFMSSITCRTALGKVSMDRDGTIKLIKKALGLAGQFDLADLFPSVKIFSFVSWNKFKLLKLRRKLDEILGNIIEEHIDNFSTTKKGNGELGTEDLIDVLLRLKESGELDFPITNDSIKSIIFDMFAGGTDTSSTAVEWAMSELMRNPRVMAKAQDEVRKAFNGRKTIEETEIHALKYLKLVINETLRLHPSVSMIPRSCREEFEINGYHIPLNANVIINIWSIGRDPNYWHNPESFEPERFETNSINFLGTNFEYLPFGSGRRICPGMNFGIANVEFLLAHLLYYFDWKLPQGVGDLDMSEIDGFVVSRKSNLHLIATPYEG